MPNFATALKEEIRRLARKEIKEQTGAAQKTIAQHRRDIAELKRQIAEQRRKCATLENRLRKQAGQAPLAEADAGEPIRFSAKSVRSQRSRLGLSAADYAKLVGVSGLTIYNWESGKSRPRAKQLEQLVAVRGIGKREALRRIAESE